MSARFDCSRTLFAAILLATFALLATVSPASCGWTTTETPAASSKVVIPAPEYAQRYVLVRTTTTGGEEAEFKAEALKLATETLSQAPTRDQVVMPEATDIMDHYPAPDSTHFVIVTYRYRKTLSELTPADLLGVAIWTGKRDYEMRESINVHVFANKDTHLKAALVRKGTAYPLFMAPGATSTHLPGGSVQSDSLGELSVGQEMFVALASELPLPEYPQPGPAPESQFFDIIPKMPLEPGETTLLASAIWTANVYYAPLIDQQGPADGNLQHKTFNYEPSPSTQGSAPEASRDIGDESEPPIDMTGSAGQFDEPGAGDIK